MHAFVAEEKARYDDFFTMFLGILRPEIVLDADDRTTLIMADMMPRARAASR